MDCLFCGEKLSALSSKDRQFCNKKHEELWEQREASIQRLKEAFNFGPSPSSQPRQAKTSTALAERQPGHGIPAEPKFKRQDPPERSVQPPVKPATPVTPPNPVAPSNPNVFYCGPVSTTDAPPNAGFITMREAKGGLRLSIFLRRPAAGELGDGSHIGAQFITPMFTRRVADERGTAFGFFMAPSGTVHPCRVRQPGCLAPT